jgi:hypothetical protein
VAAQVAGSTTTGVTVEELKTIALGWSAKKQILDNSVYNDKGEKVGDVDDLWSVAATSTNNRQGKPLACG